MSIMLDEIKSQKEVLIDTYIKNLDKVIELAEIIKKSNKTHIEIVARGSSRNATDLFKYELESNTSYRVSYVYPSTITKYNGSLNKDSIYIAVSQGGRGEDLRICMRKAKEIHALTIAVTNEENTPLNDIADHSLYLKVNKELSMAATKTFTSEMLVLEMLAFALQGKDLNKLKTVNSLIDSLIENEEKIVEFASSLKDIKNLFVITRGKLLGVGKEICCKLQETCFINANCFASSDFMHGPLALVDKTFNVLFLVPNDDTNDDVINLLNKVKENNGNIYAISKDNIDDINLLKIDNVDEDLYVFLMTYAIQLVSAHLSQILGRDPDKSRNLDKYTKTI